MQQNIKSTTTQGKTEGTLELREDIPNEVLEMMLFEGGVLGRSREEIKARYAEVSDNPYTRMWLGKMPKGRESTRLAVGLCQLHDVRLVEAQEGEITVRWRWNDDCGNASEMSFETMGEAAENAVHVLSLKMVSGSAEDTMVENLDHYRVTLHEDKGDRFVIVFDCQADDADHAAEQAIDAYPRGEVLNCTRYEGNLPPDHWARNLAPGDQVWWNDPDHHISSGYYVVDFIHGDEVTSSDDMLMLKDTAGSQAEVFAFELSPKQPEDLYPVIDGECGNVSTYGYATSAVEAIKVGNATFADPVKSAYLATDVVVGDERFQKAWVALTFLDDRYAEEIIGDRAQEYDGIEINGVRDLNDEDDGNTCCEVDNENPQFFSVYVHCKEGGVECVGDFDRYQSAVEYADELAKKHGWEVFNYVPVSVASRQDTEEDLAVFRASRSASSVGDAMREHFGMSQGCPVTN